MMKHKVMRGMLLAVCAGMTVACQSKDEWKLVWEDDFNGACIDASYWNIEDNARGGGNAELQYYSPENVTIERHPVTGESCLVLSARREDYKNRPCTSARLNTQDKVTVCYGKIEARIAFPYTADGLWPAFWMLGNNLATDLGDNDDVDALRDSLESVGRTVWPKCGEIDIVEMGHKDGIVTGTQDRFFNGACHWGESFNNGAYPNVGMFYTADYPVQGDFHLFTVIWTEDSLAMYLDLDKSEKTAALKDKSDKTAALKDKSTKTAALKDKSEKTKAELQSEDEHNRLSSFDFEPSVDGGLSTKGNDIFPDAKPYFALSLRNKEVNEPGHYFNHPFYLVLNLSVGGFFPDMPSTPKYPELITADDPSFRRVTALPADGTPVKMYVDYIRVYRQKTADAQR